MPALHAPIRRFRQARDGATAIEFAMVFPLLLVLMFGVIMIGQAFFTISSVQWAIEKASREMMINPATTGDEIEAKAKALLGDITTADFAISFADEEPGTFPLTRLNAEVSYEVSIPLVPSFEIRYRIETLIPRPYQPGA
ncbi:TadE/TadG family type IV pilus assembly protein [Lutibaculum baratangense]|nr:TadE/TadG family type IV pilus assembly protein [Lutibaculum baratangense]